MGQSSSRRRRNNYQQNPPPSQLLSSYPVSSSSSSNPPLPPPVSGYSHPPPPPAPPNYVFAANAPYHSATPYPHPQQNPYPAPPPFQFCSQYSNSYGNPSRFAGTTWNRVNYPYHGHQNNGWFPYRPSSSSSSSPSPTVPMQAPAPYVEHQNATKIRSEVNLHKDTIRLEVDEQNPDCHLVSFTFDSMVDGSITIYYFAKEGTNCSFSPLYPDICTPVTVPFQKGLGQKFRQPSGTGVDLGFFELDDLSKPSSEDAYPLVIFAEASPSHEATDEQLVKPSHTPHAQITEAVLTKKDNAPFHVKVIKQILWIDGNRYELREIFGIDNQPAEPEVNDSDQGKDCVICMSEPRDTAVLPCRHMCMCSECAKVFRLQSSNCPICRQPVQGLLEIKVNNGD